MYKFSLLWMGIFTNYIANTSINNLILICLYSSKCSSFFSHSDIIQQNTIFGHAAVWTFSKVRVLNNVTLKHLT